MDESRLHVRRHMMAKPTEGPTCAPTVATTAGRAGQRALLAVGDPATLRRCRDVLENAGFVVDAVDAGIAAVVAARAGHPDLILMESQLRDAPGREAIGWLRSNPALQTTPIIVLTASAEDEADLAALGSLAFLRKPVSSATIQRSIHEHLK